MAKQMERGELLPEDAAAIVGTARSTAYEAKRRAEAAAQGAPAASGHQPLPPQPPAPLAGSQAPARALPAAKLADLADLAARLPLAQQDQLLAAMPLDRLRMDAVVRGLAGHPAAAAAVVHELRAVTV